MNDQTDKYIPLLEDKFAKLEMLLSDPAYINPATTQDAVLLHFIGRASQIAKACMFCSQLPTPLRILNRVLCEDLFLVFWVAISESNAQEYEGGGLSEIAKMMRVNLDSRRAVIRKKSSGEKATDEFMATEFMPKLKALGSPRTKIEQIAQQCGLQRVYDIVYRFDSLEVHANTFCLSPPDENALGLTAALSSISAILKCILTILTPPRKEVKPEELLKILRVEKMPGK